MTKQEFLLKVPDILNHRSHGYAELEIVCFKKNEKGVCYRHKNNLASGGNFAPTWEELYGKIMKYHKDNNYSVYAE